jgi:hypothetical protein
MVKQTDDADIPRLLCDIAERETAQALGWARSLIRGMEARTG